VGISTGLVIADRLPNYYDASPCGCFEEFTDQDLEELQEDEKAWKGEWETFNSTTSFFNLP
jgi:hypothetical protein